MTKKKKQQLGTILALCVVLAALGIGYTFASRYQQNKEAQESDTTVELYAMEESDIASLHYVTGTADITLVKEDDVWKLDEDKKFPVEQSKVETMLGDVASVSASRVVTKDCEELSEYELEEPKLVITLTDTEGNEQQISYGLETAAAGGCYAYTDNKKEIYVVPSNVTSDFDYTRSQLMELPDTPDIDEDRVTAYSVQNKKGESFSAKYVETETEEDSDEEDSSDSTSEDEDTTQWDIKKSTGKVTDYDTNYMDTILSTLTDVTASEGVSYKASSAQLKKYGLAKPAYTVKVSYYTVETDEDDSSDDEAEEKKENHTFAMSVGKSDTTGDYYYVSIKGEDGIYLLSAETVNALVDIL